MVSPGSSDNKVSKCITEVVFICLYVRQGYTCCLMVWFGETISLTRCCVTDGSTFSLTDAIFGSCNENSKHYIWQMECLMNSTVAVQIIISHTQ